MNDRRARCGLSMLQNGVSGTTRAQCCNPGVLFHIPHRTRYARARFSACDAARNRTTTFCPTSFHNTFSLGKAYLGCTPPKQATFGKPIMWPQKVIDKESARELGQLICPAFEVLKKFKPNLATIAEGWGKPYGPDQDRNWSAVRVADTFRESWQPRYSSTERQTDVFGKPIKVHAEERDDAGRLTELQASLDHLRQSKWRELVLRTFFHEPYGPLDTRYFTSGITNDYGQPWLAFSQAYNDGTLWLRNELEEFVCFGTTYEDLEYAMRCDRSIRVNRIFAQAIQYLEPEARTYFAPDVIDSNAEGALCELINIATQGLCTAGASTVLLISSRAVDGDCELENEPWVFCGDEQSPASHLAPQEIGTKDSDRLRYSSGFVDLCERLMSLERENWRSHFEDVFRAPLSGADKLALVLQGSNVFLVRENSVFEIGYSGIQFTGVCDYLSDTSPVFALQRIGA